MRFAIGGAWLARLGDLIARLPPACTAGRWQQNRLSRLARRGPDVSSQGFLGARKRKSLTFASTTGE
jgi:hypothetical protein